MLGPDEVRIETPEQIDLTLEPAGLGSRFVARVLDLLIQFFTLVFVAFLVGILLGLAGMKFSPELLQGPLVAVLAVVAFVVLFLYDIPFELRWNGQTPGKIAAGIRVMRDGGAPVDFQASCIRNVLRTVDFLPLLYIGGAILI